MVSTAIQLFTVCEAEEPLWEIIDAVDEAGYGGVEYNEEWFPLVKRADAETEWTAPAAENDLPETPGVQVPVDLLENNFSEAVSMYAALGCRDFVIPYVDEACFETQTTVDDLADRLAAIADRLDDRGARLHYHNHDFEFREVGERTGYEVLVEQLENVHLQVDVGWVAAAGEDPIDILERYADVIDLVHLKDMVVETSTPAELGTGDVDLEACLETAETIDAEWVIYEYDWPDDPLGSLSHGAAWFEENGY